MSDKIDPAVAKRLEETRVQLRQELAEGLRRGGVALSSQVAEVLSKTNDRLERLERERSQK